MVHLRGSEAQALLRKQIKAGQSIKPGKQCLIGAGYNTCEDFNIQATDLFHMLEPQI
jgi:hypothetical protein